MYKWASTQLWAINILPHYLPDQLFSLFRWTYFSICQRLEVSVGDCGWSIQDICFRLMSPNFHHQQLFLEPLVQFGFQQIHSFRSQADCCFGSFIFTLGCFILPTMQFCDKFSSALLDIQQAFDRFQFDPQRSSHQFWSRYYFSARFTANAQLWGARQGTRGHLDQFFQSETTIAVSFCGILFTIAHTYRLQYSLLSVDKPFLWYRHFSSYFDA